MQVAASGDARARVASARRGKLSLIIDYGYIVSYGLFFALAGFAIRDLARVRGWRTPGQIRVGSVGRFWQRIEVRQRGYARRSLILIVM